MNSGPDATPGIGAAPIFGPITHSSNLFNLSDTRHRCTASSFTTGNMTAMSTSRNPAGRPALWGPRTAKNFYIPDHLLEQLKKRAEEAGMSLSAYAVTLMADAQGVDLRAGALRNTDTDKMAS